MIVNLKRLSALVPAVALVACGGGGGDSLFTPSSSASAPTTAASGGTGGGGAAAGGGISTVSSGVPSQRSMSLSVEKYALNWSVDGDTTTITARITDTAGNPVPNGTPVQFSTEGGQVQTSCALTGVMQGTTTISACSVNFATQNLRPLNGLITVLAWLEGQEAFIDLNGNGAYDSGEPFYDTGRLFRDDNTNAAYDAGVDELNVGGTVTTAPGLGAATCGVYPGTSTATLDATSFGFSLPAPSFYFLGSAPASVPATCDGQWGRTLVRGSVTLPVSDPRTMSIVAVAARRVRVSADFAAANLRPSTPTAAPAGTAVSLVGTPPMNCTIEITPPAVSVVAVLPTVHDLVATGTGCAGSVTVRARFGDIEVSTAVTL
jgi:hypothetical protein